jgi:hypothetical protein
MPRVVVATASFLLIFAVTANHFAHPRREVPEVGGVASEDYRAPYDVEFQDTQATERAREQAADQVAPIYKLNDEVTNKIIQNFQGFFAALSQYASDMEAAPTQAEVSRTHPGGGEEPVRSKEEIENEAAGELLKRLDETLVISRQLVTPVTAEDLRKLLTMSQDSRDRLSDVVDRSIREQIISVFYETDLERILGVLRETILGKAREASLSTDDALLAATISAYFIQPTAQYDEAATEAARKDARDNTPTVTGRARENEVVLRKGDIITQRDLDILDALGMLGERRKIHAWPAILLFALILGAGYALSIVYVGTTKGTHLRDLRYYILLYLIFTIAYLTSFLLIRWSNQAGMGEDGTALTMASLPVIAAAVLFAHYIGRIVSATMSCLLAILISLAAGDSNMLLPAIMPSIAASLLVSQDCPKPQMIRAIVLLPLFWTAGVLGQAYSSGVDISSFFSNPWFFLAGIAPAPAAMILANYLLDGAFNFPTANRLREFDNQDHPLLRKLQLEAPGTWHHSMMISLISEAACQAVGGNSVLVRVGSMYHDIGKTKRPEFFIENQRSGVNVHDKYSPWLSKIIVESHVKDGITMARAHGLPEELIDLIPQHHGTSLITYFFRKALAMSEDGVVSEYDYRYPGPRPQSLEGACINIADAFESSTRSLEDPTPHRIRALAERIFEERLLDGQYDECGLALNQLQTIKETIIERLIGAYHARIEYPEEEELRRQFQLKRVEGEKAPQRAEQAVDSEDE